MVKGMDCAECGTPFEPRRNGGKPQRHCSALCRKRSAFRAFKERDPDYSKRWYRDNIERWDEYVAKARAKPGVKEAAAIKYKQWALDNPDKYKAAQRRWRAANPREIRRYSRERAALKRSVMCESFDELEIYERDGWICQWCLKPVDPLLANRDPMSKSLDHRIPLSKGGVHSRANCQLVHLRCNSVKKDRLTLG